jgi:TetR/AcrR family transcriptional repressor of nem operon
MPVGSKGKILHVAREQFYRNGFLVTSVDDIIAHAKVSKSNFYYHFKSKEELGLAVLDTRCEEFENAMACTLCNDDQDPIDRVKSFFQIVTEIQSHHASGGCPFGNLVAEMSEHSERFRTVLSNLFCKLAGILSGVIQEGQEIGQIRNDFSADEASALIIQAIQGASLLQKCHRTREVQSHTLNLIVKLIQPTA